jgi:hypothetical protein
VAAAVRAGRGGGESRLIDTALHRARLAAAVPYLPVA